MTNIRRARPAADVAVGFAADAQGKGIAYAAISTGSSAGTVRLTFSAPPLAGLDGREQGYAAIAAVAAHLKVRGFVRVRLRVSDARVVSELAGAGSPPKALAMAFVKIRCALHGLGAARLEVADPVAVDDLTARAQAEVSLNVAA